ncbi:unnamed protein product [Effrenium voratum]|uniref:Uncharacterized protein n=1 Tax=Effrenium voratum TaxID=2562239 RepID=A0AA36JND0_9DINO|nr:unnamed protein product [Effrenium voratum]
MRRHQCRSGSRCKLGLLFRESHGWPSRCSLLVLLIFLVNQDRLPSKRLREWSEVTAKRRRTGSWHCPPLVSPRADTAGRSLLAKRRDSEARSASQLVDAGSKKPAHSDAKKAVAGSLSKASDQSDSEESNDTGSDGEAEADGQTVGGKAQDDAIEVKDAETLWRVNIEAVYRRKNPKLLSKVSELIAKYKANGTPLSHLYAKVCRTYELDPKVMWATRSEAEEDEGDADGACFKDNAFEEGEAKDGPSGPSGAAKPEASNSTSSMVPGSIFGDSLGLAAAGKPADGDAQSASSSSIFTFGAAKPPDSSTGGLFSASDAKPSTDIFRFGAEPAQSGSSASGSLFAPVGTGGSIFGDATAGSAANIQSGSQSASPSDIFASLFGASSGSSSASSGSSGIFGATSGSSSIFGNSGAVPGESANSGASSILGSSGSIFGAGSSGASSIFGASSGSASNIFASSGPGAGPSTGASIFGESSAPSIFGGSSSGSNPGASGSSSIFGANTGGGSSMFGANTASSSNIFGASSGSSDMFVAASGGGSNIFGATSGGGPPVFGATSGGGSSIFGATSGGSAGIFGATSGEVPCVWSDFGRRLKHLWCNFGRKRRHLWCDFGSRSQCVWCDFGRRLKHLWCNFGRKRRYLWCDFGRRVKHLWCDIRRRLQYLWGDFRRSHKQLWCDFSRRSEYFWCNIWWCVKHFRRKPQREFRHLWRSKWCNVRCSTCCPCDCIWHFRRPAAEWAGECFWSAECWRQHLPVWRPTSAKRRRSFGQPTSGSSMFMFGQAPQSQGGGFGPSPGFGAPAAPFGNQGAPFGGQPAGPELLPRPRRVDVPLELHQDRVRSVGRRVLAAIFSHSQMHRGRHLGEG